MSLSLMLLSRVGLWDRQDVTPRGEFGSRPLFSPPPPRSPVSGEAQDVMQKLECDCQLPANNPGSMGSDTIPCADIPDATL